VNGGQLPHLFSGPLWLIYTLEVEVNDVVVPYSLAPISTADTRVVELVCVWCRLCGVCNRGFSEASFLRYPNGAVAHIHCANAANVSSSSSSSSFASRPALTL